MQIGDVIQLNMYLISTLLAGKFLRGTGGSYGGGIYFAGSQAMAEQCSAHGNSAVFQCVV